MSELRTALEGHDESLEWRDFQGTVPKARPPGEAAYTEARFDLNYGYDYDTEHATKGYRITEVHIRVTLERARMWVVTSAKTADLLQHEQGHYDIVALLSRDLFQELTGWNTAKPPKRFRKEIDLTGAAERLRRSTRALILQLDGSGRNVGVYDKQTNHGLDAKAQEQWNKALAAARNNGTRVMTGLSGLGVGGP